VAIPIHRETPLWIRNHDLSRLIQSAVGASLCRRTPNLLSGSIPSLSLEVLHLCLIRVHPRPIFFSHKIHCKHRYTMIQGGSKKSIPDRDSQSITHSSCHILLFWEGCEALEQLLCKE